MKRTKWTFMVSAVATFVLAVATAQQPAASAPSQPGQQVTPKVQVNPVSRSKASSPTPGANATNKAQKSAIGKGSLAVSTAQPDSFWEEQIDVAGNGKAAVITDFLYDAPTGVVYAFREDDVTCSNGQTARADVLDAVFADGNKSGKPAGSGWYAVSLDAGKCGIKESGVYGCRYNASGSPTECGVAVINTRTGELDVAVAE